MMDQDAIANIFEDDLEKEERNHQVARANAHAALYQATKASILA